MKTIADLDDFDNPREKLTKKGVQALKDYELYNGLKNQDRRFA
jgi:DNA repair protein RadC